MSTPAGRVQRDNEGPAPIKPGSQCAKPIEGPFFPAKRDIRNAREVGAVALRMALLVSLDDRLTVVREFLNPNASRSDLDQSPQRWFRKYEQPGSRPSMRFVTVKSEDTQALLMTHKAREFLVRQQTQIVNAIRAHLGEFGLVVPKGIHNVERLIAACDRADLPTPARKALNLLVDQLVDTQKKIEALTADMAATEIMPASTETLLPRGSHPYTVQARRRAAWS